MSLNVSTKLVIYVAISILATIAIVSANNSKAGKRKNLEKSQVVPDVINYVPSKDLFITYQNDTKLRVLEGNELESKQVCKMPTSVQCKVDSDKLYLLAFVNPDAPDPENPTSYEIVQWLVVNIKGQDLIDGGAVKGDTLVDYRLYCPKKGKQREVFAIFQQSGEISPSTTVVDKTNFSLRVFVAENSADYKHAVSANFFFDSCST